MIAITHWPPVCDMTSRVDPHRLCASSDVPPASADAAWRTYDNGGPREREVDERADGVAGSRDPRVGVVLGREHDRHDPPERVQRQAGRNDDQHRTAVLRLARFG